MKNRIIAVTGPSGAGKTTLGKILLESGLHRISRVITATTRSKRDNEKHGKDYYFLKLKDFLKKRSEGFFLETEEVYKGKWYGTPKNEFKRISDKGHVPIVVIDVWGAQTLWGLYGAEVCIINVITKDAEEAARRIIDRDGDNEQTRERIAKIPDEIMVGKMVQTVQIVNDDLEESSKKIVQIVREFLNQVEMST